jgi:hypothetical protein
LKEIRRGGDFRQKIRGKSSDVARRHMFEETRAPSSRSRRRYCRDARDDAIETSTSHEVDTTKVSVTKHFGHSKVRESKPGLSDSMIRNAIASPHFWHRGPLNRSANIASRPIRSCSTFVACRGPRNNGTALRKSYVRKVTDFGN